jgi:hypothetical protein
MIDWGLVRSGLADKELMMRKKNLLSLTFLAFAFASLSSSQLNAQTQSGNWYVTISPAAGGTKTAFSISNTGNVSTGFNFDTSPDPFTPLGAIGIGWSGSFGSPLGAWTFASTNFTISPIGYATNITLGTSKEFTLLGFVRSSGGRQNLNIGFTGTNPSLRITNNDVVAYKLSPTPAEFEINMAFSNFNPGTYNSDPGNGVLFSMEIVPEPSTYALLLFSGAASIWALRRRKS